MKDKLKKAGQWAWRHKVGLTVATAAAAYIVYLVFREHSEPEYHEIAVFRKVLDGETPMDAAKAVMGPNTVTTVKDGFLGISRVFNSADNGGSIGIPL